MKRHTHGFSLLELSIVLVIIGLIAGGIVAGASMIRAAELRAITTEYNQYKIAMHTFRDKYLALPGDIKNAYDFWGVAAGCTDVDSMTDSAGCNGNGNNRIEQYAEGLRAWQHLALADLISGSFTGSDAGDDAILGGNVPESKISGAGYQIFDDIFSATGWTGSQSANTFYFMRLAAWRADTSASPDRIGGTGVLSCEESWSLDKKTDDGKPGTGAWLLHYDISNGCISNADMTTAEYVFTDTAARAQIEYQYLK